MQTLLLRILLILSLPSTAPAQGLFQLDSHKARDVQPAEVVHWYADSIVVGVENVGELRVRLKTDHDFTLYQDQLRFSYGDGLPLTPATQPIPKKVLDPVSGEYKNVYDDGDFTFKIKSLPQDPTFTLSIRYISCTSKICLFPYTEKLDISIIASEITKKPKTTSSPSMSMEQTLLTKFKTSSSNFWLLLFIAFLGGLLTNFTPCVYPMIPITIRLLSSQSKRPLWSASAYAFGIMVTYTTLGSVAAATGSLFGSFMANPVVNVVLALLMSFLAFTMIGFFNFTALQSLGNTIGQGKKGLQAAFFMGVGAGFIASPCTGPILAVLLGYAATQNNIVESTALLITYSFGFALPYVALGNFASKVSRIQLPSWIFSIVKTIFAGSMFALSFYYLRIPLYKQLVNFHHWSTVIYSTLFLSGLLLLQVIKTESKHLIAAASILLGLSLFSMSRTLGSQAPTDMWLKDETVALNLAREEQRPLLIDMWAEWCEACKKMDATTFSSKQVLKYFKDEKWILLKMDLTEDNQTTQDLQKKYQLGGLPTLVLIYPDQKPLLKPGYISAEDLLIYLKEQQ